MMEERHLQEDTCILNEGCTEQTFNGSLASLHSLPDNLALRQSSLHQNFYGIWSRENIASGTRFGPYIGFITNDPEEERIAEMKNRQKLDEVPSNWLEYINHAFSEEQQNLLLFKFQEQIYYISYIDIPANTELLAGYRDDNGWNRMNLANESNEFYKVSHASYKPFEYNICGMELSMQYYLQNTFHTGITSYEYGECRNESANGSYLKAHEMIYAMEPFTQDTDLKDNKSVCVNQMPYECNECGKIFAQCKYLRRHKELHIGAKLYECNECGKKFAQNKYLKRHKIIHTGEKPYKCDVCGKTFAENADLKRHKRIHTGEKPYQCDICGKGFSENKSLKRHKTLHTGEKPYKCDECEKTFAENADLKRHKIIHSNEKPYKCDECGKAFARNLALKTHKRVHTGERPYECDECGRKFAQNEDLKRHKMLHSGVKPFGCDECGKKFAQNKNLKRHKMLHTRKKSYK